MELRVDGWSSSSWCDALARNGDSRSARKIGCSRGILRFQNFLERPFRDDLATARAGVRPEIKNVVGRADRFLVVLDHDDGIPEIAQPTQRADEARIIALMQTDAGLVEHIEHAGKTGADLRREPDALCLAPGKRATLAIEREIIEPDFEEEIEPRGNFLHHLGDDCALRFRQLQLPDELRSGRDR